MASSCSCWSPAFGPCPLASSAVLLAPALPRRSRPGIRSGRGSSFDISAVVALQTPLHHPRRSRTCFSRRLTLSLAAQLVDDRLNQRLMHVRRIAKTIHIPVGTAQDDDIFIGADGGGDLSL